MPMQVRGQQFYGDSDRFVSGNRDMTYLGYPIIQGTLDAVGELYPELAEELTEKGARPLAVFCNEAIQSDMKPVDILANLRKGLAALSPQTEYALCRELTLAFMEQFMIGLRETVTCPFMSDDEIQKATTIGLVLAALPDDMRKVVGSTLRIYMTMPGSLERPKPRGRKEQADADKGQG